MQRKARSRLGIRQHLHVLNYRWDCSSAKSAHHSGRGLSLWAHRISSGNHNDNNSHAKFGAENAVHPSKDLSSILNCLCSGYHTLTLM